MLGICVSVKFKSLILHLFLEMDEKKSPMLCTTAPATCYNHTNTKITLSYLNGSHTPSAFTQEKCAIACFTFHARNWQSLVAATLHTKKICAHLFLLQSGMYFIYSSWHIPDGEMHCVCSFSCREILSCLLYIPFREVIIFFFLLRLFTPHSTQGSYVLFFSYSGCLVHIPHREMIRLLIVSGKY